MSHNKFTCPRCQSTYKIKVFHPGFSDVCVMRCDSCPTTVLLDIYHPNFSTLLDIHDSSYDKDFFKELESQLNKCDCGGSFFHNALCRCKSCNAPIDFADIQTQIDYSFHCEPGIVMARRASASKVWRNK